MNCNWKLKEKYFSNEISDINNCDILLLYSKMHEYLEDLHNSVTQYFPND